MTLLAGVQIPEATDLLTYLTYTAMHEFSQFYV